jgi:glucose uptake protein
MPALLYAVATVLAWGTWLAPAQNIPFKNQQVRTFYVGVANLALATVVTLLVGGFGELTWDIFWLPFLGGLIWAVSSWCAFTATRQLGMARAQGLWAPLNIVVSILWGALLFQEFPASGAGTQALFVLAVAVIVAGVLLIIAARSETSTRRSHREITIGLLGALGAGILWGTYFIPIKLSQASLWIASWPLAVGIFAGSVGLVALARQSPRLDRRSYYGRALLSGATWGVGNYTMLLLVGELGAGRGFTIAQLGIVVNALIGIYVLKDPRPRTRAATLTLIGCVLAMAGSILLGNIS